MLNRDTTHSHQEPEVKFIKKLNGENRDAVSGAAGSAAVENPHSAGQTSVDKSDGLKGSEGSTQKLDGSRRPGGGCIPVSGFDR